jgi:co-chaperonin GroES (HSP10)
MKLLGNLILLNPIKEVDKKTKSGLAYVEHEEKTNSKLCTVVEVADKVKTVKKGDKVFVHRYIGSVVTIDHEDMIIVNERDIMAKITGDEE